MCLCRITHQHQILVKFPFDNDSGVLCQNHFLAHFAMPLCREISHLVSGCTHFCRASSLVNTECTSTLRASTELLVVSVYPAAGCPDLADASRFKHSILSQSFIPSFLLKYWLQLCSPLPPPEAFGIKIQHRKTMIHLLNL